MQVNGGGQPVRTHLGTSEDSEIALDVLDRQETTWGLWTTGDLDNRQSQG